MLGSQQMTLEGVIIKSAASKDAYVYSVLTKDAVFEVLSKEFFEVGKAVKVNGSIVERYGSVALQAEKIELLQRERASELFSQIETKIANSINLNECDMLLGDAVADSLKPTIEKVAKKLLAAQKMERFILLRFHNDADGIAGALALTAFLKCRAFQQNSAIYSAGEAINDINTLQNGWKPLLILLDFGSNEESIAGLRLVLASGAEVVIIDHHPPTEKLQELNISILNSWIAGAENARTENASAGDSKDLSKYTAGYLACEIARFIPPQDAKRQEAKRETSSTELARYAAVACAGDKSKILPISQAEKDIALVLDYVAAYSRYGNNLEFYRSVLKNDDLFKSILMQANEQIANMRDIAGRTMKEKIIKGVCVCVLDLENISKDDDFPGRGKITTAIFESLSQDKPILVIGYGTRSVILRLNELAEQKGLAAQELVEKVKITMQDFVETGGGHRKAAAIRVKSGFGKDVANEIVRIIEAD